MSLRPMVNNVPPLPPSGAFVSSIRETSRSLRLASDVLIKTGSIKQLLLSPTFISSFKRVTASHGLAFPLNFPSVLSELNLISILSLLNFGSGYRITLHNAVGRGAWDTIRALVFSLYLSSSVGNEGNLLSAKGMQTIPDYKIAELLGVSQHVERPHETIPSVTVGELGGPMHDFVKLITGTLNDTGNVLVNMGYPDLGSFVLEALRDSEKARSEDNVTAGIEFILERLVGAIPAFRDMTIVDDQPIYCFKKALFLIHAINLRFSVASPKPFPIPSTSHLPIFADNVIPSLLVHLGVIDVSSSSSLLPLLRPWVPSDETLMPLLAAAPGGDSLKESPKEGPVLSSDQAYILRAAAIDACELIVQTARSLDVPISSEGESLQWITEITLPDLDMWLWAVAKDRHDYRMLERFVQKNTVFF